MPLDDFPPDALKRQYELEDSSISPVGAALAKFGSAIPLPSPLDKVFGPLFAWFKDHLASDEKDRIKLLVETVIAEARKHDERIKQLEAQVSRFSPHAAKDLLLDAARKAANTRAKERVKRIGLIFANGIVEPKDIDSDEIEEMMRVAMELSDSDVSYLNKLVEVERHPVEAYGRIGRPDAYQRWPWGDTLNPEIESTFSKLESYGLVARIAPPNNLNIMADFGNRFALLPKGLRFVTLVQQQA